jgi:prophage antirepressor-like protein
MRLAGRYSPLKLSAPWFKADDVCKALADKALIDHVKCQYKSSLNDIIDGSSLNGSFRRDREGQQPYISEPGVYALIFGSKLPTADAFWCSHK